MDAVLLARREWVGVILIPARQHIFVETDHEIFSTVIAPPPPPHHPHALSMTEERQLSATGGNMDMTITVSVDVKQ